MSGPPIQSHAPQDLIDEEQGPVVYHPIWLINTVGLQQSVIDLITVIKFNKDEGLIEGTECSVCLSEFAEDESLRLLPKCRHAFHLPCIDTWLRSHKNCPLCRAPVMHETVTSHVVEQNSGESGASAEDREADNLETHSGFGSSEVEESGTAEVGVGHGGVAVLEVEEARTTHEILRKDLGFSVEQPARRSFSMDLSTASESYLEISNAVAVKNEGTSHMPLAPGKKMNMDMVALRMNGNSSLYKLMKSSSIGSSLHKDPLSMKRSLSSIAKFSSRRIRSRNSSLSLGE